MRLSTTSFENGGSIPPRYAFDKPEPEIHATFSDNVNPALSWTDVPEGTRSFALICYDRDVPSVGEDVNQEDREVPPDLPRVDFFHWVVIDLSAGLRSIDEVSSPTGSCPGASR